VPKLRHHAREGDRPLPSVRSPTKRGVTKISVAQLIRDGRLVLTCVTVTVGIIVVGLVAILQPSMLSQVIGFIGTLLGGVSTAMYVSRNGEKKLELMLSRQPDVTQLVQMARDVVQQLVNITEHVVKGGATG